MKMIKLSIIGAVALSFASAVQTHAITNTAITISGTNLVLSWPSYGYETYLVQYRQTLDTTDSWSVLTNAYPANSTNRTTFTLYGLVPPPASGGGSGSGNLVGGPPSPSFASGSVMARNSGPLLVPTDGSGGAVPLALYPPGFNLSGYTIIDPLTGESANGAGYVIRLQALGAAQPLDDPSGDPPPPETGFYRVFHIPNFLANFSGYTFNGPTFISVDYAPPDAPVDYVDNTTVLINGQPTDEAIFMPYVINGVTNWGVGIYFDRFPNGTNTIQLLTTVRESDTLNDQTPYMVFSNAPAAINIGNSITFTNWSELILSNTYTFQAQTVPNVNWEIDIYDVYDNFVNYQTGYSADGNISWTWNLMDYWGNSRLGDSDPFFFPYITVTQNSSSPTQSGGAQPNAGSSTSSWMPPLAEQFPSQGDWIFTYMDKFYDDGTSNYVGGTSYMLNGIHTMEGGPAEWNIGLLEVPVKFGRTYSQTNRDSSWESLGLWLESWNNRNFYYFGHGSPNSIGGDISTLDSSNNITGAQNLPSGHAYLTAQWVHDNVTFNKTWGPMPFRFVYLDGCDTAAGNWPWAWGVPKQSVSPDWYKNSGNNPSGFRPNAFAGWDVEIGGSKDWGTMDKFWEFRKDWMAEWAGTFQEQLDDAFDTARSVSNWVDFGHYSHLKKYGYTAMTFFQYNHGGDWP
jgi:hypothetical protein